MMFQLLLREPLVCLYPFFVLLLLAWAIWTRPKHSLHPSCSRSTLLPREPTRDYENRGGARMPHRFGLRSSDVAAFPPPFDRLHATAAADYGELFEKMNSRIQRRRGA